MSVLLFNMNIRKANLFLVIWILIIISTNGFSQTLASRPDVRKYNLALGKYVFWENCVKCHGTSKEDTPQLGSITDWERRILMPVETLIQHAVNGHRNMPPKGGLEELTNRHVSAAVAYIVDQGRRLIIVSDGKATIKETEVCGKNVDPETCTKSQINNMLLLELFWFLSGQSTK